jgi:hypothetical protein
VYCVFYLLCKGITQNEYSVAVRFCVSVERSVIIVVKCPVSVVCSVGVFEVCDSRCPFGVSGFFVVSRH